MQVTILQHEPGEHAGFFEQLWAEYGIPHQTLKLYETQEIPAVAGTHLLIMGGSMSVHDEREFPFLREEKRLIRQWVGAHLPVLGVCLGAQLIAQALESCVYPCQKELGWVLLTGREGSKSAIFPRQFHAFQLHGDTFDIPSRGILLCSGRLVPHQAFSVGSAMGLQFHVEMTAPMIEEWTRDCRGQEKEQISADTSRYLISSHAICRRVAEWFVNRNKGNS
jgi:GMP synthase (glutamine-hydrolysing)